MVGYQAVSLCFLELQRVLLLTVVLHTQFLRMYFHVLKQLSLRGYLLTWIFQMCFFK